MSEIEAAAAIVVVLTLVLLSAVLGALDGFAWYRRFLGGHWERWEPGFFRPVWWLRSPTGQCSGRSEHSSGRRRTACEDW